MPSQITSSSNSLNGLIGNDELIQSSSSSSSSSSSTSSHNNENIRNHHLHHQQQHNGHNGTTIHTTTNTNNHQSNQQLSPDHSPTSNAVQMWSLYANGTNGATVAGFGGQNGLFNRCIAGLSQLRLVEFSGFLEKRRDPEIVNKNFYYFSKILFFIK